MLAQRGGAATDPAGQAGRCCLAYDLLLRGSAGGDHLAFSSAVEGLGSSIDAETGAGYAALQGLCLARNLEATWDLLLAARLQPSLEPAPLAQLVDESVDALVAGRDDDEAVAEHFLRQALYAGQALARAPEGTPAELQALRPRRPACLPAGPDQHRSGAGHGRGHRPAHGRAPGGTAGGGPADRTGPAAAGAAGTAAAGAADLGGGQAGPHPGAAAAGDPDGRRPPRPTWRRSGSASPPSVAPSPRP